MSCLLYTSWGRLVFVLLVLAVLLTGAFWGTVWIYDNFINPPKVDVVGASDKITQNEKLNKRINILLLGIDDGDSDAAPDLSLIHISRGLAVVKKGEQWGIIDEAGNFVIEPKYKELQAVIISI